jgi:opacity protein-like surface antigen
MGFQVRVGFLQQTASGMRTGKHPAWESYKRRRNDVKILGILVMLLLPAAVLAQSSPAAVGGEASLWAGAEATSFNPDFGCASNSPFRCFGNWVAGPTAFFDFNLGAKWGVEGEARWLDWHSRGGQSQSSYLLGGRYRLVRFHRLTGWAKLLMGGGWIQTPFYPQAGTLKGSFFAYAPGGTVEYPIWHRLAVRGDYEYQIWPSFYGPPSTSSTGTVVQHNDGLTPNGFSVGVTYRILGQ